MAERLNTVVCTFDPASPRLTAYDNHEWLHAELRNQESQVSMIQIDGIRRQAFIKMVDKDSFARHVWSSKIQIPYWGNVHGEYRHGGYGYQAHTDRKSAP